MTSPLTPSQRAVVLSGIPVAAPATVAEPVVVDQAELRALIAWAGGERLTGLLRRALHASDLSIDPTISPGDASDVVAALDEAMLAAARSSLAAEATGLAAVVALRSAGIEPVLFKGLATAHTDYGDPSERTFFDADILVARKELAAAVVALAEAGFRRAGPPAMSAAWERRFARAVELRFVEGVELDLHASLATGYFGQVLDHDLIRMDVVDVPLGGIGCSVFGPTTRLLISCYAIVLSRGPNLRLYADLVRQLVVTGSDWRQAAQWAGVGDCVIAEALRRVGTLLGLRHPAITWAQAIIPAATAERALDLAQVAERDGWSADARSALLALGPVDRTRYLAGIAENRLRRRRR